MRRWWNWQEYLEHERPELEPVFEHFEQALAELYSGYTFEFAERESGVPAATLEEIAKAVASAGTRFSSHNWRSAAAGNLGGWQVSRCLFLLNALLGAVATEGGAFRTPGTSSCRKPIHTPPHPKIWNELTWPREYPLSMNELSFLLPHFLKERPRQARRLLHARLQPGLDEPRRVLLDRGADRRELIGCTSR